MPPSDVTEKQLMDKLVVDKTDKNIGHPSRSEIVERVWSFLSPHT